MAAPALSLLLAVAAAGQTITVEPPKTGEEDRPRVITPVGAPPTAGLEDLFAAAEGAIAQRAWERADAAYRRVWLNPQTREAGAEALNRLHRTPGFRLAVDAKSLEATRGLLGPGFRRSDTPHFVVLSDCDVGWTNTRAQVLERTRDQYFRVARRMAVPVVPHEHKLLCILFQNHETYRAFARTHDGVEASWVAGYYSTNANRIVFFNEASAPGYADANSNLETYRTRVRSLREQAETAKTNGRAATADELNTKADALELGVRSASQKLTAHAAAGSTRKAIHECIHLLSFNTGMQFRDHDYPFWLSEGLATNFETDQVGRAFGPDRTVDTDRRELFDELAAASKLMPVESLVRLNEVPEGTDAADGLYSQSFVLFNYLFNKDPRKLGGYIQTLGGGTSGRRQGPEFREVFSQHFGDPVSVETDLGLKR